MVHRHADEEDYATLLSELGRAVEERARAIVEGRAKSTYPAKHDELWRSNAQQICDEGYCPPFMMIDGAVAERSAIESVYPGMCIRMCQFHLMQSITSKLRNIFGNDTNGRDKAFRCLAPIRSAQRCPREELWPEYRQRLEESINDIAGHNRAGLGKATAALAYLDAQWFGDESQWRPYCVDYGLPPHLARDGLASTNNWVEAAFRVFDRIFLNCRANNR
jgi:hypothetical protein